MTAPNSPRGAGHETRTLSRRLRDWWIDQVIRHHRLILVLGSLLTVLTVWLTSQLELDSDLRALIPRDHAVIQSLERVEANFGTVGSINVVIEGGEAEARHALADAIAEEVEGDPMLREVNHRLASEFFIERALYYLDEDEMDVLVERIEAWQHYELCSAVPDLCIEPPDPDAPEALQTFIDGKRDALQEQTGFRDYYEREELGALVLFLRPSKSSADLDFAVEVSEHMSERVAEVFARDGPWREGDLRYNLVGAYVNKATERKIVARDMVRSGAVALLGVISVLYLLFRSWRAIATLLIPLLCGVAWSLGATELVLGHLNTITSLISSVVLGIGIDAGIHILTRARREREVHDSEESVRRAFKGVIAPLLIASSTTASTFLVMATSKFPAFGEFGIIASLGVGLCLLSMLTIYPALLIFVGVEPARHMPPSGIGSATRVLLARPGVTFVGVVILTLASFKGVDHMREHGFERNGRPLQSDQARELLDPDVFLISEIFGYDVHASVISVDGYDELDRIYGLARKRHEQQREVGDTLVAELVAVPSLMPSAEIDQVARRARIAALTEDWSPRTWARLEGKDPAELPDGWDAPDDAWGEFEAFEAADETDEADGGESGGGESSGSQARPAEAPPDEPPDEPPAEPEDDGLELEDGKILKRMLEAQPFGPEDLPDKVVGNMRGANDSWAIFAYPNYDSADILTGVEFMRETESYVDGAGTFVGEPTVFATLYVILQREWPVIIGMAMLMITALVFWQVRDVGQTLLTIAPLVLAFWWTFGILGTFDLKLSLFNVPILPAILGIGVDNGVYLTAAIRRESSTSTGLHRSVDETGRAILAATVTTAIGFGAFLVADSGGLRSIGQLAVIGILVAAVASLLAVPTIAALVQRRRDRP